MFELKKRINTKRKKSCFISVLENVVGGISSPFQIWLQHIYTHARTYSESLCLEIEEEEEKKMKV